MKRLLAGLAAAAALAVAPAASATAQDAPTITLLHGIPGATVDVSVGGQVLLPGFEPGATQDLSAFAGQTLSNVEVLAAGTTDVVISIPELVVPDAGNWTVMAHLDAEGTPIVTPFENDTTPTAAGEGRLTARHTAAAPAVDIVVGEDRPATDLVNGGEAALTLPAGPFSGAQVALAGGDPLVSVPPVTITEGVNLIVYAVGSPADASFTFYTQEIEVGVEGAAGDGDGTAEPTEVATGSPIDGGANLALLGGALAMLAMAGGALTLRRRTSNA